MYKVNHINAFAASRCCKNKCAVKLPHLKLDETLWQGSNVSEDSAFFTFFRRIFHVVLHHEGPITKFTLSIPELKICPEIDDLLFFLSKSGVEELRLHVWSGQYKLPSSFFRCQKLKHTRLPSGFNGFSQLRTLKMWDVAIGPEQLRSFVARCPLLEHLELKISSIYDTLEIYAPRLKSFKFLSFISSLYFKNTPLLEEISIYAHMYLNEGEYMEEGNSNFDEFFSSLPMLRALHLDRLFMSCLIEDGVPTRPSLNAAHLNILFLEWICLEDFEEMSCVLFLIRSAPNLQELFINVMTTDWSNC